MNLNQLGRRISSLFDSGAPPLNLEDITSSSSSSSSTPRLTGPSRTLLVGASALAAVAFFVAVAIVMTSDETPQDPVTPPSIPELAATSTTAVPTTTTTGARDEVQLPIDIPDGTTRRDVDDATLISPDWTLLEPAPIESRWPGVITWTGEEIVIWGDSGLGGGGNSVTDGAAYDPVEASWRLLPQPPLEMGPEVEWVWTGEELIIWGNHDAIAWSPATNTWRLIEDWPLTGGFYRQAIWTGEYIVDLQAKLLVDPVTGESREIGGGPEIPPASRATAVWTGRYAMWVTGEGAYDVGNQWFSIPHNPLSDAATVGLAIDELTVFAVDYEMRSATYDFVANSWESGPVIPLRFYECNPKLHQTGPALVVETCSGIAALPDSGSHWIPFGYPRAGDEWHWNLIAAGDDLYAWGEGGFAVLNEPGLLTGATPPKRLSFGIGFIDPPDDWKLIVALAEVSASTDEITQLVFEAQSGGVCLATSLTRSVVSGAAELLRERASNMTSVVEVIPSVGGLPYEAIEIEMDPVDEFHRLVWAVSTTDIVDVACIDSGDTRRLAESIWTLWG